MNIRKKVTSVTATALNVRRLRLRSLNNLNQKGYEMCDFLSVYIGWDGEILCGNMSSHESAESHHKLNKKLASRRPPVPMEWTEDDDGDSISVRVPHDIDDDRNESYYKAIILADYKTRQNLIVSILESGNYGGSLYLSGCR